MLISAYNVGEALDSAIGLQPFGTTNAQALYDTYHNDHCSTSYSIVPPTSCVVNITKEQVQTLQGGRT